MKTLNHRLTFLLACGFMMAARPLFSQEAASVTQLIQDSQRALAAEKADDAESLARRAVDQDPAHAPAWRQYGLSLLHNKKTQAAADALRRATELDEKDTTAWRGLAMAYWQSDRQNEAVRALSAYLRLKPEDTSVWRDLATWLTRLGQGDPAVAALERVVQLKPDDASAWRELGAWRSRQKQYEQAADALRKTTAITPNDVSAWRGLADALTKLKRDEQAADALQHVVAITPEDAAAWRELATALTKLQRYEQAADALRRAVAINPDEAAAWRELALLHQRGGRADEALKAFEKALSARPDDPATRRDLGWVLWAQGRRDEALAYLTQAVESGVDARDRVIYQVVARLSEEGREKQALAFLHRVEPNRPTTELGLAMAKANRMKAAGSLLANAWQQGERAPEVGVYLAYARAINGQFSDLPVYLQPLLDAKGTASPQLADLALETLRLGGTRPETPALATRLEAVLGASDTARSRVTDILETGADASRVNDTPAAALALYRRVLARDPNRASWIWAVLLAERVEGKTPYAWLDDYEKRVSNPARRAGVEGIRADRLGHRPEAVTALRQSLALDPNQPQLRVILFDSLLVQGRVAEARVEADWFAQQVEAGEAVLRSYLAEMLTRLGDFSAALAEWEMLHQTSPDSVYYAIENANALYRLGRPDEAMALLQGMTEHVQDPRLYEMLAEITSARARYAEAVTWSARGLDQKPTQALLRYHAENLEALETNAPAALADARAFLANDVGNVPLTLLAGRMLEPAGATNEVTPFHLRQLDRNPVFVPSLVALRDRTTRDGEIDEAVGYAQQRVSFQPHNPEAVRAYANSLAQQDHFHQALNLLRPLARTPLEQAVPVLVYQSVTPHPYDGRNTVGQISRHIKRLADNGFVFVNAFGQIDETPKARHVMLVLIDPEPDVIEALDPVLKQYGARVVYAGNADVPTLTLSGTPISERLAPVLASGRWNLASGGPADFRRGPVNEARVLGNPLTHPLMTDAGRESERAFEGRIDRSLADASRTLDSRQERVLVYPTGDFGNRSLDTDTNHVAALRRAVANHFTHAIYFDDSGFYLRDAETDPLRIPARLVPPGWDEAALAAYLGAGHPLTRARLELARILYWDGQHEAAYAAFVEAEKAGADPRELIFNWGMNADRQNDLPTAREKLLAARALEPESEERIQAALDRLDDRRRPYATAFLSGWRDNEDRNHYRYGAFGDLYVSERIRLGLMADRDRWSTKGLGSEYGTRYGIRGLAYLAPEIWLSGSLWKLDMDNLSDHWGGDLALRLPNPWLSGYLMLTASREEIETVEALRANIDADTYALRTYTRLYDVFDLFADLSQIQRSDGNNTTMLDGRLLYRLQEWPYIGVGWRFRIADSDRDPPEYWAPEQLQQHQAHITVRGAHGKWSYAASAEAGYAKERDTNWRFVWGARGNVDYAITRRVSLSGELGYFESPDYNRTYGRIAVTGRF